MKKRIIIAMVTLAAVISSNFTVFGAQTLYEKVSVSRVVKGVTYDNKYRLTDEGWLDLHIITIDLNNSNISVEPILSEKETGLRERVSQLLTTNGAVAGVNSAYFGLTGNHSAAFGPQIADGEILSIDADKNLNGNQFGTYFTDNSGKAYFEYFKTNLDFYVEGKSHFEVAGMNAITEMIYPVYIDRNAMETTSQIDSKFKDITKIVVEGNRIVKISAKGEVVSIPHDGYVIALSSNFADVFVKNFSVGQFTEFKVSTIFDVERIENAISGGGIILKDGIKPTNYGEMASGRHPRTLLGVSADGSTMKLIVAEGQRAGGSTPSIGLTVDEAVELLKAEGMYNGINLDGGGSSMMALKSSDQNSVANVSDSAEATERPVVAAIGVFNNSVIGDMEELVIKPSAQSVLVGGTTTFEVFGYDENYNKISVPMNEVKFSATTEAGNMTGNIFNAKKMGEVFISAQYKEFVANVKINVSDISSIITDKKEIGLAVGQSSVIDVKGLTSDGYSVSISGVNYSSSIGTMDGNRFIADKEGTGYIKCAYNGLETHIKVIVGTKEVLLNSFENIKYLDYSASSTEISGIAGISTANVTNGQKALGLSYYFKAAQTTQAAYLSFPQAITLEGNPVSLKLDVKGNGSGQWVRAKILDATGKEEIIDFSRDVNWTDWKTLSVDIPSGLTYPISLKTIYVASLSNTNTNQQVMYFDNLKGQIPVASDVELPKDIKRADVLEADISNKEQGYTYFSFTGNVVGVLQDKNLYTSARVAVNNALGKNTDYAVFAGSTDISATNNAKHVVKWQEGYSVSEKENITLINMFAKYGGLKNTQKDQWLKFKTDAINAKNKSIIIVIDRGLDAFSDKAEADLFRSALKDISDAGKNVFVVYANATTYQAVFRDGVRYISLPNLWNNGKVNSEYKIVRFKANSDTIKFEAIDIFK